MIDVTKENLTKADNKFKSDDELLSLVTDRIALTSKETGVTDFFIVEGAIGALFVGQYYGIKILRIIHSSRTLREYEKFLGQSFEDLLPQHGQFIDRSYAWTAVRLTKHYWDLVNRRFSMEGHQKRAIVDSAP